MYFNQSQVSLIFTDFVAYGDHPVVPGEENKALMKQQHVDDCRTFADER